jgi:hypothetical protein
MISMLWTEDRVEKLKACIDLGYSASETAAELGGITRNSVIGKMSRLGLQSKNTFNNSSFKKTKRSPRPRAQKVSIFATRWGAFDKDIKPPEHIVIAEVVSEPLHRPLARLNNITCRWPYGESVPYSFCGCPTTSAPYCEAHTAQSIGKGTTSERLASYVPKEIVAA